MSPAHERNLISHAVIIVSMCLGSWILLVKPRADQVAAMERAIAASDSSDTVDEQTVLMIADAVAEYRQKFEQIQHRNSLGADTSGLYTRVSSLARRHSIEVLRMDPGRAQRRLPEGGGTLSVVDISIHGRFDDVTRFAEELERMPGFLRPASLTMTPARGAFETGVLDVRLTVELLSFDLPDVVGQRLAGGRDVDA